MVVNKVKKVHKYRGGTTHGGGSRKKRRGAGSRGGRGNAGTGKRAGQKKAGVGNVLGRSGFRPRRMIIVTKAINVGRFTPLFVEKLVKSGKAVKENDLTTIDLSKIGYDKLLGTGTISLKLKLIITKFTPSAEEKIKAAGGEIISAK
jgi:large subunit ribosomal protein L15